MIAHPEPVLYTIALLGSIYGQCQLLANRLHRYGQPSAAAAVEMSEAMLGEALRRLGVPLPGNAQDMQERPLVFGVQPRVGPDERFDGGGALRSVG